MQKTRRTGLRMVRIFFAFKKVLFRKVAPPKESAKCFPAALPLCCRIPGGQKIVVPSSKTWGSSGCRSKCDPGPFGFIVGRPLWGAQGLLRTRLKDRWGVDRHRSRRMLVAILPHPQFVFLAFGRGVASKIFGAKSQDEMKSHYFGGAMHF